MMFSNTTELMMIGMQLACDDICRLGRVEEVTVNVSVTDVEEVIVTVIVRDIDSATVIVHEVAENTHAHSSLPPHRSKRRRLVTLFWVETQPAFTEDQFVLPTLHLLFFLS